MSKKYKSITDIFAEQRRMLLHGIIAHQRELKRAKELPQFEASDTPGKQESSPNRFALEDFMQNTTKKSRPSLTRERH
ncbi:hypothetical protein ACQ643_003074 [Escherichia coli]|nr:hypothetical protein [Escherichia coli]